MPLQATMSLVSGALPVRSSFLIAMLNPIAASARIYYGGMLCLSKMMMTMIVHR